MFFIQHGVRTNKHPSFETAKKRRWKGLSGENVFLLLNSCDESAAVDWMKRREEVVVAGGGKIEGAERAAVPKMEDVGERVGS